MPGITSIQQLFSDSPLNAQGVYAIGCLALALIWQQNPCGLPCQTSPMTPATLRRYFQTIAWEIATGYARAGLGGTDMGAPGIEPAPTDVDPASIPGLLHATSAPVVMDGSTITTTSLATAGAPGADLYVVLALTPALAQPKTASTVFGLRTAANETALQLTLRTDIDRFLLENSLSGGSHAFMLYGDADVAAQTPLVMECWLDGSSALIRGLGTPGTTTLTPSANATTAIRFGNPDWGGEVFSGTIHGLAVFDRIPTDAERLALRAWAHERAGVTFTERAVPVLLIPN